MIKTEIFNRSLEVTKEILNKSINLQAVKAADNIAYAERDNFFQQLVGDNGYVTFHPEVNSDIAITIKDMLKQEYKLLRDTYYNMSYGNPEASLIQFRYSLTSVLEDYIQSSHLLDNKVPDDVTNWLEQCLDERWNNAVSVREAKKIRSPKLSKLLVKLYGEQHEIVKWYTNQCPKQLSKGLLENWSITVSILPHHIAGMSYYAPLNHGGVKWAEGYNGTSCMDTKGNGAGSGVFQLMPSLKDTTMAVAFLSCSTDDDPWNPIYQARTLLRVVHVNGKPIVIACRTYYTDNEANHVLIDGLKNQLGIHYVKEMRSDMRGTEWVKVDVTYPESIEFSFDEAEVTCPECEGEGNLGLDDAGDSIYCRHCEGEGHWHISGDDEYLPYIDDGDIFNVRDYKMTFKLPVNYFNKVGIDITEPNEEVVEEVRAASIADAVQEVREVIQADFAAVEGRVMEGLVDAVGVVDEGYFAAGRAARARVAEAAVAQDVVHNVVQERPMRFARAMNVGQALHREVGVQLEDALFDRETLRNLLGIAPVRFVQDDIIPIQEAQHGVFRPAALDGQQIRFLYPERLGDGLQAHRTPVGRAD